MTSRAFALSLLLSLAPASLGAQTPSRFGDDLDGQVGVLIAFHERLETMPAAELEAAVLEMFTWMAAAEGDRCSFTRDEMARLEEEGPLALLEILGIAAEPSQATYVLLQNGRKLRSLLEVLAEEAEDAGRKAEFAAGIEWLRARSDAPSRHLDAAAAALQARGAFTMTSDAIVLADCAES